VRASELSVGGTESPSSSLNGSEPSVTAAGDSPPTNTSPSTGSDAPSSSGAGSAGNGLTLSSSQRGGVPAYPPTAVRSWLVCPEFSRLGKLWKPRVVAWQPNLLIGTMIHAGIAEHFRGHPATSIQNAMTAALADGFVEQETWTKEALLALATKGIKLVVDNVTLTKGARIIAIEEKIHGRVVDLITSLDSKLTVYDWKSVMSLDSRYVTDRLNEFHHSWQLLDYAYHAQDYYQRQVESVSPVLVILGPRAMVRMQPVTISQERLKQWHDQAQTVWWAMATGITWMNMEACDDRHLFFGKSCPFKGGCHDLAGDESLFHSLYERIV
jgi:PD-(D/E)XK nuclease superfamily protein